MTDTTTPETPLQTPPAPESPEATQTPETPQSPPTPESPQEDVLPPTTSQRTYLSDDGHGPVPETARDRGPVTTYADHVPEGAPVLLTTKVVAAPAAEAAQTSTAAVETG